MSLTPYLDIKEAVFAVKERRSLDDIPMTAMSELCTDPDKHGLTFGDLSYLLEQVTNVTDKMFSVHSKQYDQQVVKDLTDRVKTLELKVKRFEDFIDQVTDAFRGE